MLNKLNEEYPELVDLINSKLEKCSLDDDENLVTSDVDNQSDKVTQGSIKPDVDNQPNRGTIKKCFEICVEIPINAESFPDKEDVTQEKENKERDSESE